MSRAARKKSKSGYYHIVFRGINKQDIFYDDEDREVFLSRLKIIKEQSNYKVLAFCLMDNHVHLLVKEIEEEIGRIIGKVLSSYVYWYNSKYERIGNLFQDRFRSEPIEDDGYLLCCIRYILQNPLKANLCEDIWKYRWSSAALLLEEKESFVDAEIVKGMLQDKGDMINFMEKQDEYQFLEWESKVKLTDERLKEKIVKVLGNDNIYAIMKKNKEEREETLKKIMAVEGVNVLQVSRITGVPYHFIRYLE